MFRVREVQAELETLRRSRGDLERATVQIAEEVRGVKVSFLNFVQHSGIEIVYKNAELFHMFSFFLSFLYSYVFFIRFVQGQLDSQLGEVGSMANELRSRIQETEHSLRSQVSIYMISFKMLVLSNYKIQKY